MSKRKILSNWIRPITILMSVLWVMMIPIVFYFAMEKNGEYRLLHDKEPFAHK